MGPEQRGGHDHKKVGRGIFTDSSISMNCQCMHRQIDVERALQMISLSDCMGMLLEQQKFNCTKMSAVRGEEGMGSTHVVLTMQEAPGGRR